MTNIKNKKHQNRKYEHPNHKAGLYPEFKLLSNKSQKIQINTDLPHTKKIKIIKNEKSPSVIMPFPSFGQTSIYKSNRPNTTE